MKKRVSKKKVAHLALIICFILIATIGYIVYSKYISSKVRYSPPKDISQTSSNNILGGSFISSGENRFYPKKLGYIVQLKSKPFFECENKDRYNCRNNLVEEHEFAIREIKNVLKREIAPTNKFDNALNALVYSDISESECNLLKEKINTVKGCYENLEVHTLLDKSLPSIKADLAFSQFGLTGNNVVIAVIDTGIDANHESLDDLDDNLSTNDTKVIAFKDFVNFKQNTYDDHGHGTHVAGIAAGTGGNSSYKGVAPKAKLVGVKVLNSYGLGSLSDMIAGMEWVLQNKNKYNISIISMSLGVNANGDGSSPVEIAATTIVENGINVVVAAGNSGPGKNSVGVPASAKKVITVGAVDNNHKIAYFSSRGPTKDGRIKPEITAPGVSIMAPQANSINQYIKSSGTSMATPHVSGVVALIKEAAPNLTPDQIIEILKETAVDKGKKGPDNDYGWGVIDVFSSLSKSYPQEQHDLMVKDIDSEENYDTKTNIKISPLIKNNGLNNESNVKVKLYINGIEKSNRIIDFIEAKSEKLIDFAFFVKEEGNVSLTVSVDSVNGENITFNNNLTKEIVIRDIDKEINVVVLDSWGTYFSSETIFPYLNDKWYLYGDDKVNIDFESFNGEKITYDKLKKSKADVLIISNAWSDGKFFYYIELYDINWEFEDSEIEAIKEYVKEGHGLIMTAGSLSQNLPGGVENNMKLSPLFGLDEKSESEWAKLIFTNEFNINYFNHDIFKNVEDYLPHSSFISISFNFTFNKEYPGELLANVVDNKANVVDNKTVIVGHHYGLGNTVYFANLVEYIRSDQPDKQVLYNALIHASEKYEESKHDVRLESNNNNYKIKSKSYNDISVKLINKGKNKESNISIKYFIDDKKIQNMSIETLEVNESRDFLFNFSFNESGDHIILINSSIIDNETKVYDNSIKRKILFPEVFFNRVIKDYGIDRDNDGLYDSLAIDLEFEFNNLIKSFVISTGILYSQLGSHISSSENFSEFSYGLNNLTLKFSGLDIRRKSLNGPYKLDYLELNTDSRRYNNLLKPSYNTNNYSYTNFESYPDISANNVYFYSDRLFVNKTYDLEVSLVNIGSENAKNINVSLYQKKANTDVYTLLNVTLIDNITIFDRKYIIFSLTPKETGYFEFLINANEKNDENFNNNNYSIYTQVYLDLPYLTGYFSINRNKAVLNKPFSFKANIRNIGNKTANDVLLSIYKDKDLLSTRKLGPINPGNYIDESFSFSPKELGEFYLVGKLSASNEIIADDFVEKILVIPDGVDVTGSIDQITYPLIVNETGKLSVYIENIGTKNAENVKAILYENISGVLSQIEEIKIGKLRLDEFIQKEISWTPKNLNVGLVLEIKADNDINIDNNIIIKYLDIKLKSSDVVSSFSGRNTLLTFNKTNILPFIVYNNGAIKATNVNISFYLYERYFNGSTYLNNFTLLDSNKLGDINADKHKSVNFSYTPSKKGYIDFRINVSADNEVYQYIGNNINDFSLKSIEGADLSLYIDYIARAFINNKINLSFEVSNNGVEDAKNVNISFYEYANTSSKEFDWKIISSQSINNFKVNEFEKRSFKYTPKRLGNIEIKINASAINEGDYSNNENIQVISVLPDGLDITVSFDLIKGKFVKNKKISIPVTVENLGNKEAFNITTVKLLRGEGKSVTNIDSKTIKTLRKSEKVELKFDYVPEFSGVHNLIVEARNDEDVYQSNNRNMASLEVVDSVTDLSGSFDFRNSYAFNNEVNLIDITVKDHDIVGAKNISVELYDNKTLINKFFIKEIGPGDSVFIRNVEWVPNIIGEHNIVLIVNVEKDINLKNNYYNRTINVFNKKPITFNILNLSGTHLSRYLTINDERFYARSPYKINITDVNKSDIGFTNIYYDDNSYKDVSVSFLDSKITNLMNLTTHYYENLKDKNLSFKIIYANKPNWNYTNISYYFLYYDKNNKSDNADIYGCINWNFISLSCDSEWIKDNKTFVYSGNDGLYVEGLFKDKVNVLGLVEVKKKINVTEKKNETSDRNATTRSSTASTLDEGTRRASESDSGGGGGGGGISSTSKSERRNFGFKKSNEYLNIKLDNKGLKIDSIELGFINDQNSGTIIFKDLDFPDNIPLPKERTYSYFSIDHPSIKNDNIKEGKINFKVSKKWIVENNIDKNSIVLLLYENGWNELSTNFKHSDSQYNYYSSDTQRLSTYAISVRRIQNVVKSTDQTKTTIKEGEVNTQTQDTEDSDMAKKSKAKIYLLFFIGLISLLIVIIIIVIFLNIKKKTKLNYVSEQDLTVAKTL